MKPNMETTWFVPGESQTFLSNEDDLPDNFSDIPLEVPGGIPAIGGVAGAAALASQSRMAFRRGRAYVFYVGTRDPVGLPELPGNVLLFQAERPMCPYGPSMIYIEVHTTGVKTRSLGHENEKACWSLIMNNALWRSGRSNLGTRNCTTEAEITQWYPAGLTYRASSQWAP